MNPIQRLFQAILEIVSGLVRALLGGMAAAPVTAATRAIEGVDIRRGAPSEVIDVRHAVLRQGRPRTTAIFDGDDHAKTRHWIAKHGGEVIGVVSVMPAPFPDETATLPFSHPPGLQLRGMATRPSWRGKGVGVALLKAVEAEVGEALWCNARTSASGFYAAHGWEAAGPPFEIPEVGPHVRMVRAPSEHRQ